MEGFFDPEYNGCGRFDLGPPPLSVGVCQVSQFRVIPTFATYLHASLRGFIYFI